MKGYENSKVPGLFCLMKDRKIKAKQLAEVLGVSEGNVSDWKSGKSAPSAAIRKIIADYLGVTVDDLLAEDPGQTATSEQKEKAPIESDEGGEESIKDYLHRLVDRMDDDGARDLLSHAEEIVLQRPKNLK